MATKKDFMPYVAYALDDAGAVRRPTDAPNNARLVAWSCGFEPLAVLVWSYLPGVTLGADEAEEIAAEYLRERGWFGEDERAADYVF
jgi:hypothetical protein